ncbi:energy-coupling factor ABC transporter ATP-binding protein [Tepidibacillus fermentans]|uniref:Cobalt/nickel transport system ATP-binding protein n=1 Tax=Tepidibacillus fermentans TaxID=1281767 RepID=A0A4R3KA15_9BACI|nr:energy-coupling factor ABC transporter ATP-binding protein [Tepidibacillus fermentans]TCS79914.1 cobalt/nickel transport system ATP-binding protein [Tepidibacillus fermentans]
MEPPMIEFENVIYQYSNGTVALDHLTLKIPNSKKVALIGHNGAGKSTLLGHINGIFRPKSGKVTVNQKELKYSPRELNRLRRKVGIVFQDPEQQLFLSNVWEDIAYGLKNLNLPDKMIQEKVQFIMEYLHITHLVQRPIHYLSLGEKKLVALAGVLVMEPEILLLDEPTAYLEPKAIERLIQFLEEKSSSKLILLSTHDLELAYQWADHLIVLKNGKKLKEGTPLEIFSDATILRDSGLKPPIFWEIYQGLLKQKRIDSSIKPPTSSTELLSLLHNICK